MFYHGSVSVRMKHWCRQSTAVLVMERTVDRSPCTGRDREGQCGATKKGEGRCDALMRAKRRSPDRAGRQAAAWSGGPVLALHFQC